MFAKTVKKARASQFAYACNFSTSHTPVAIVGGGCAGLTVAHQIVNNHLFSKSDIRILDPSPYHYYQPGWTMVGGGLFDQHETVREMSSLYDGYKFESERVADLKPEKNTIVTADGNTFTYDYLVVATGIENDVDRIKGLRSAFEDDDHPVATIYDFHSAAKTSRLRENFTGGRALFTQAAQPIKCAGAPQKIMYLCADTWKHKPYMLSGKPEIHFFTEIGGMFAIPKYNEGLKKVAASYDTIPHWFTKLVEVDKDNFVATFQNVQTGEQTQEYYDFMHVTPYQRAPEFLRKSGLTDETGFVAVNKDTLQSTKFPNVWGLGDSSNLPTSRTATAIFNQAPVLVENFHKTLEKQGDLHNYDGQTACPVLTGDKKVYLCEFKYGGEVSESFSNVGRNVFKDNWVLLPLAGLFNNDRPNRFFYELKRSFGDLYWTFGTVGRWAGPHGPIAATSLNGMLLIFVAGVGGVYFLTYTL